MCKENKKVSPKKGIGMNIALAAMAGGREGDNLVGVFKKECSKKSWLSHRVRITGAVSG